MTYKYSRDFLFKYILLQKKTKNGVYWCPELKNMIKETGNILDNDFYYNRSVFFEKRFWVQKDFYYFLAKNNNIKFFFEDWQKLNTKFNNENSDILNKKINEKKEGLLVFDIIDNYLIFNDYFFDI